MNLTVNPAALELTKKERLSNENPNGLSQADIDRCRKHFRLAKAIWDGPVGSKRVNKLAKQLGVGFQFNGINDTK